MKSILLIISLFIIIGCGSGGTTSSENAETTTDTNIEIVDTATETTEIEENQNISEEINETIQDQNISEEEIVEDPKPIDEDILIIYEEKNDCSGKIEIKGQVIDIYNKGIPNISIELNGCRVKSDNNGSYILKNKKEEKAYIKISSNIYAKTYIPIEVKKNLKVINTKSSNYLITVLSKYSNTDKYNSTHLFNKSNVFIKKSNYINNKEEKYNGEISIYISNRNINKKENKRNFPGEFKGLNSNGVLVNFESLGIMEISLKDYQENNLKIEEPIKITFSSINSSDDELPLWKFNEETYTWEEVGLVYKKENGEYEGEISRTGIWAINKEFEKEKGTYIVRIVTTDGDPVNNLRVYIIGDNWISSKLTSDTENDGVFEMPVKSGEKFSIYAFTYKDNYIAEYKGELLGPVASGEVLDDRS